MTGWKTIAGALIIAGSAALNYYGYPKEAELMLTIGAGLGLIGIGHKLDRVSSSCDQQPYSTRRDGGK